MKIAMIGAGAMGGATVEGLIKATYVKIEDITVADPSEQVLEKFAQQGVSVTTDNHILINYNPIINLREKMFIIICMFERNFIIFAYFK